MNEAHKASPHGEAVRTMVLALLGEADPVGVELRRMVRMLGNQYDAAEDEALRQVGLSGSRFALLLRLMGEEVLNARTEVSPTYLSHCLNVSKNTVSSLLRGLEDQGFVARELDPDDRRAFRIRLTDTGRAAIRATAPEHAAFLNRLAERLTAEERMQLVALLSKLHKSITYALPGEARQGRQRTDKSAISG